MSPRVHSFYEEVLDAAETAAFVDALEVEGVDGEVAVLRVRLRRVLAEAPEDAKMLESFAKLVLRAVETRRRLGADPQALDTNGDAYMQAIFATVREAARALAEEAVR
jgi:hypothetical protein